MNAKKPFSGNPQGPGRHEEVRAFFVGQSLSMAPVTPRRRNARAFVERRPVDERIFPAGAELRGVPSLAESACRRTPAEGGSGIPGSRQPARNRRRGDRRTGPRLGDRTGVSGLNENERSRLRKNSTGRSGKRSRPVDGASVVDMRGRSRPQVRRAPSEPFCGERVEKTRADPLSASTGWTRRRLRRGRSTPNPAPRKNFETFRCDRGNAFRNSGIAAMPSPYGNCRPVFRPAVERP